MLGRRGRAHAEDRRPHRRDYAGTARPHRRLRLPRRGRHGPRAAAQARPRALPLLPRCPAHRAAGPRGTRPARRQDRGTGPATWRTARGRVIMRRDPARYGRHPVRRALTRGLYRLLGLAALGALAVALAPVTVAAGGAAAFGWWRGRGQRAGGAAWHRSRAGVAAAGCRARTGVAGDVAAGWARAPRRGRGRRR